MKIVVLKIFFIGKASIGELRENFKADQVSKKEPIVEMSSNYLVTCRDLVKLCDAVLAEELAPNVLELIGLCLVASDKFEWDNNDSDGSIVQEIVKFWLSPESHFPLTIENVEMFREILCAASMLLLATFLSSNGKSENPLYIRRGKPATVKDES